MSWQLRKQKKVYMQTLYIHALYNTMYIHFVRLLNFIPEEQGAFNQFNLKKTLESLTAGIPQCGNRIATEIK